MFTLLAGSVTQQDGSNKLFLHLEVEKMRQDHQGRHKPSVTLSDTAKLKKCAFQHKCNKSAHNLRVQILG